MRRSPCVCNSQKDKQENDFDFACLLIYRMHPSDMRAITSDENAYCIALIFRGSKFLLNFAN